MYKSPPAFHERPGSKEGLLFALCQELEGTDTEAIRHTQSTDGDALKTLDFNRCVVGQTTDLAILALGDDDADSLPVLSFSVIYKTHVHRLDE